MISNNNSVDEKINKNLKYNISFKTKVYIYILYSPIISYYLSNFNI